MQSRMIGTDSGLNMIDIASDSVVKTATDAASQSTALTSNFLTESQQRTKQILDLQTQMEAVRSQKPVDNPLGAIADSVGKLLIQQQQLKAKKAAEAEKVNQTVKGTRLKSALANNEIANKETQKRADESNLIIRGDTEAQLVSLYQQEPGVERFRSQGAKIISDAIDRGLSSKDTVELMRDFVNKPAMDRHDQRGKRLDDEMQKLQDAKVDQITETQRLLMQPSLSTLRNLPPTEQAKPYLDAISNNIKSVIANPALTEEQRYRISTALIREAREAYGTKAEAFSKLNSNLDKMANYLQLGKQARAEFEADGNLDKYKGKIRYAKELYGDWGDAMAQPGEAEKFKADVASNLNTTQRLETEAKQRLGVNLNFTEQETQMIAKRMLTNPAYLIEMKKSPEFSSNRSVQAAITLAESYEAYSKDKVELENWKADEGVNYANLNLRVATNRAQLIESIARATAAQKSGTITPEQQATLNFNQRALQNMPELQFIVDQMAQKLKPNGSGNIDPNELKKAADLTEQGLIGVMNATNAKVRQREQALIDKYPALQQYNMMRPRDVLTKEASHEQQQLDQRLENARQLIQQQQIQQSQPQQYGQQSPFDAASTLGAEIDANGLLKIAPRQRLNTTTYNGKTLVTPVLGQKTVVTSQWHASRDGGHRLHAGGDFDAKMGTHAVALVSGTVGYIGEDPKGYGGYMDIIGDNGFVYRYGHQGGFKFKPGQRVKPGDIVSVSDGSGAGDPHLHFEVHPKANYDSNGRYQPAYGESATIDPLEHLAKMNANNSSVLMPRMKTSAGTRSNPRYKVPNNAALLPQGGALMANTVQFMGSNPRNARGVMTNQRPIRTGSLPWNLGEVGSTQYDYNDDMGYAKLRANPQFLKAIVDSARELQVPQEWIADIIRQESGEKMSVSDRSNGGSNVGLFGFGNDSFNDIRTSQINKMNEVQQVQLFTRYMKDAGWMKHLAKKGGSADISQFWAMLRMGTGWRNRVLKDSVGFLDQRMNDTGVLWRDELKLLGKWAGRSYGIPGTRSRQLRSSAVTEDQHASCKICQQLLNSGSSILPHSHDIG